MKVFLEKRGKGREEWVVCFKFGVQTFTLDGRYNKRDASWFAKMLRVCFKSYTKSIRPTTTLK